MFRRLGNAGIVLVVAGAGLWGSGLLSGGSAREAADEPEARKRPPMPEITEPVLFNTKEADKIVAALQVFPPNNPWNEDISKRPVLRNSARLIASVGADKGLAFNTDMGFVLVPPNQPKVPVRLTAYSDESDPGPYPVPDNAPIEDWPFEGGTLAQVQRNGKGDRHMLVVDPVNRMLYEFYQARRTDAGWQAAQASVFNLKSNRIRPAGWTSTDAAGLPIFPAVIRHDDVERGIVDHAMRFTVRRTRRAYVYPATHFASRSNDPSLPRMGERFRLRQDYDVSGFPSHAQAVLKGLKKYGMFVADNGLDWRLSVAPDKRIAGLETLRRVKGRDFEVVQPTGPNEGPRAK
jgi:hypothetical protein